MNDPRQLELFSDGARAVAAGHQRPAAPRPTEADLQAKLDAARVHFQALERFREERPE
jgi:hypothetical protein